MADLKETRHEQDMRDDLSDVASERAEVQTLHDEPLPSYSDSHPESSPPPILPPEKQGHPLQPTASAPFNFPTTELPSYDISEDIRKPIAIPQSSPAQTSPFVAAYPPELLSYGIPEDSWLSFVDTLSAFISANISQQALHHATDVALRVRDSHKQYVKGVKNHAREIGKSAKHLNPFGIVGGSLGLVFGSVGHVIGSVFSTPFTITEKPKTPIERATVYVAAANKDWFNARGLHALLLNTADLATVVGVSKETLLAAVLREELGDIAQQLRSLSQWIANLTVRDPAWKGHKTAGPSLQPVSTTSSEASRSSKATGKQPSTTSQIQLSVNTLWLVLIEQKKAEALAAAT